MELLSSLLLLIGIGVSTALIIWSSRREASYLKNRIDNVDCKIDEMDKRIYDLSLDTHYFTGLSDMSTSEKKIPSKSPTPNNIGPIPSFVKKMEKDSKKLNL